MRKVTTTLNGMNLEVSFATEYQQYEYDVKDPYMKEAMASPAMSELQDDDKYYMSAVQYNKNRDWIMSAVTHLTDSHASISDPVKIAMLKRLGKLGTLNEEGKKQLHELVTKSCVDTAKAAEPSAELNKPTVPSPDITKLAQEQADKISPTIKS